MNPIFFHFKRFWVYYFIIFLYLSIVPTEILYRHLSFKTSGWDLGIYHQALSALSRFDNLNPYISMRMVFVFQDHFDIILILIAPIFKIWNSAITLLVLDQFFTFLGLIPIVLVSERFLRDNKEINSSFFRLVILTTYLFNDFLWSAIYFPSHPTHWAMAFISWVCYFIFYKRFNFWFWISVVLLFSCREEFPFLFLPLSFILLQQKKKLHAAVLSIVGIVWVLLILLRPIWLGPVSDYSSFVSLFYRSPTKYFSQFFDSVFTIDFILPFLLITLFFSIYVKGISYSFLLLALIPFLLRVFCLKSTAFEYHYSAIFIPLILFHFFIILTIKPSIYKKIGWYFIFLVFVGQLLQSHPFQHPYSSIIKYYQNKTIYKQYESIIQELNDDNVVIAAPNNWLPHLTSNIHTRTIAFSIDSSLTHEVDIWIWQEGGDYFPSKQTAQELKEKLYPIMSSYVWIRYDENIILWKKPDMRNWIPH